MTPGHQVFTVMDAGQVVSPLPLPVWEEEQFIFLQKINCSSFLTENKLLGDVKKDHWQRKYKPAFTKGVKNRLPETISVTFSNKSSG